MYVDDECKKTSDDVADKIERYLDKKEKWDSAIKK